MQALWVGHAKTGNTCEGLENNMRVDYSRVLHMTGVIESITCIHGLIDM